MYLMTQLTPPKRSSLENLISAWALSLLPLVLVAYFTYGRFDFSNNEPTRLDSIVFYSCVSLFALLQTALVFVSSSSRQSTIWRTAVLAFAVLALVPEYFVLLLFATFLFLPAIALCFIVALITILRILKRRNYVTRR